VVRVTRDTPAWSLLLLPLLLLLLLLLVLPGGVLQVYVLT
jgi:hypothetical protein